jgi:SAM-dependent methyltransferase
MLRVAAAKAKAAGVDHLITFHHLSLQALGGRTLAGGSFDGILSNFGGLNTIPHWRALAAELAQLLRPGGRAVLVPMGPVCPWEIGWHLLHGQIGLATRRLRGTAPARIGNAHIPIWYPSARQLQADFAPWFRSVHTESLGLWLPPTYLGHLLARWPALFRHLGRLEEATAHHGCAWGDHYISVLERLP